MIGYFDDDLIVRLISDGGSCSGDLVVGNTIFWVGEWVVGEDIWVGDGMVFFFFFFFFFWEKECEE